MPNFNSNIMVLVACWVLVTGVGAYLTFSQQPKELERVQKAEKVMRLKQAEISTLLAEEASSSELASEAARKWRSRYKVIPDSLSSPAVIGHLNELTQEGFENFDVKFGEASMNPDYSYYTFNVSGRGYYSSLYGFVWALENNRNFYRIRNLNLDHLDLIKQVEETGRDKLQIMVSFDMEIESYYGAHEAMSAPQTLYASLEDGEGGKQALPLVPPEVLPDERPAINPFFPVIMEELPPNTHDLVDIEESKLISIADGKAVFRDQEGRYRMLSVGDAVYLGQVVSVDPKGDRVVARLNKGGIIDQIDMELHSGERYRQAIGPQLLTPLE
jgi:hypothetical protein